MVHFVSIYIDVLYSDISIGYIYLYLDTYTVFDIFTFSGSRPCKSKNPFINKNFAKYIRNCIFAFYMHSSSSGSPAGKVSCFLNVFHVFHAKYFDFNKIYLINCPGQPSRSGHITTAVLLDATRMIYDRPHRSDRKWCVTTIYK